MRSCRISAAAAAASVAAIPAATGLYERRCACCEFVVPTHCSCTYDDASECLQLALRSCHKCWRCWSVLFRTIEPIRCSGAVCECIERLRQQCIWTIIIRTSTIVVCSSATTAASASCNSTAAGQKGSPSWRMECKPNSDRCDEYS